MHDQYGCCVETDSEAVSLEAERDQSKRLLSRKEMIEAGTRVQGMEMERNGEI